MIVAAGRTSTGPSAVRKSGGRRERRDIDSILTRRERLVAELAELRGRAGSSQFADKAQQLLTRWWSGATWSAREQILNSAEWLIRLERSSAVSRAS